jgi:hypothetical protein
MEMSGRTGRHGKGISTGRGTEEGNGMERRDGNLTSMAMIKEEAEEGMAIKPMLASANESSGEVVQCAYFPGVGFQEIFSLFPSTKAFSVERMLFTFIR